MRIAIPLQGTVCSPHFGGSEEVVIITVDDESRQILSEVFLNFPEHRPGTYPTFIAEQGVDLVIAGGIGERAIIMLADQGIRTLAGAPPLPPSQLVGLWIKGQLETAENTCDHDGCDHATGTS